MDFTAPFRAKFKQAAAEGAVLELTLRMLCETVPSLKHLAHDKQIVDAERAVIGYFSKHLTDEERALLETARQLRNKILHADFREARQSLKAAGQVPGSSGIRMITIDPEGDATKQLSDALSVGAAAGTGIANTQSTREGTVYGWLAELGIAGDFDLAVGVFQRAVAILNRLVVLNAGPAEGQNRRPDT